MKQYLLYLLFLTNLSFLFPYPLLAEEHNVSFETSLITGMRMDELQWSIAGDENNPVNILSELKFNDIKVYYYGVGATFSVYNFFIQPEIIKGHIYEGWATDSDYSKDNRKLLTFKSEKDVNNNDTRCITFLIGYDFKFIDKRFSLSPVVGYSKKKQEIVMAKGNVLYPENRPIVGLNSKYATDWEGVFVGIRSKYVFGPGITINTFLHCHHLEYEAVADWNLRKDLSHPVSFRHSGYGQGVEWGGGIGYSIKNWMFGLSYKYNFFKIEDGRDDLYFSSGETIQSKLNEVEWQSKGLNFKISYVFE